MPTVAVAVLLASVVACTSTPEDSVSPTSSSSSASSPDGSGEPAEGGALVPPNDAFTPFDQNDEVDAPTVVDGPPVAATLSWMTGPQIADGTILDHGSITSWVGRAAGESATLGDGWYRYFAPDGSAVACTSAQACVGIGSDGSIAMSLSPDAPREVFTSVGDYLGRFLPDGTVLDRAAPDVEMTALVEQTGVDLAGLFDEASRRAPFAGGVTGDPHLVTARGQRFTTQSVGQFVARGGDAHHAIEVQFLPMAHRDDVTIVSAVAISTGSELVTVDLNGQVTVDGGVLDIRTANNDRPFSESSGVDAANVAPPPARPPTNSSAAPDDPDDPGADDDVPGSTEPGDVDPGGGADDTDSPDPGDAPGLPEQPPSSTPQPTSPTAEPTPPTDTPGVTTTSHSTPPATTHPTASTGHDGSTAAARSTPQPAAGAPAPSPGLPRDADEGADRTDDVIMRAAAVSGEQRAHDVLRGVRSVRALSSPVDARGQRTFAQHALASGAAVGLWAADETGTSTVAVSWPDGGSVSVEIRPALGLTVVAHLYPTPEAVGIFGTTASTGSDLVSRSGEEAVTAADAAGAVASWRTRTAERLLPAFSFTSPPTLAGPGAISSQAQQTAQQLCREVGMIRLADVAACAYDVAVTGDTGFIAGHLTMAVPAQSLQVPAAFARRWPALQVSARAATHSLESGNVTATIGSGSTEVFRISATGGGVVGLLGLPACQPEDAVARWDSSAWRLFDTNGMPIGPRLPLCGAQWSAPIPAGDYLLAIGAADARPSLDLNAVLVLP